MFGFIFIVILSIVLKILLFKKYDSVMNLFPFRNKSCLNLETVSLRPLRGNKDRKVKSVYYIDI